MAVLIAAAIVMLMGLIDVLGWSFDATYHRAITSLTFTVILIAVPVALVVIWGLVDAALYVLAVLCVIALVTKYVFSGHAIHLAYLSAVPAAVTVLSNRYVGMMSCLTVSILIIGLPQIPISQTSPEMRQRRSVAIESMSICVATVMSTLAAIALLDRTGRRASDEAGDRKHNTARAPRNIVAQYTRDAVHDLSNLLTAISSYAGLLPSSERRAAILDATERATKLTVQMLELGENINSVAEPTPLHEIIRDQQSALRNLFGIERRITYSLAAANDWILCEPAKVQQILLNLTRNARDATDHRGHLSIATELVGDSVFDEPEMQWNSPASFVLETVADTDNDWVLLSVTDNGQGIASDELPRVFEPYYTSKSHGRGTGLGLPMAHDYIQQLGGQIQLLSKPGVGTAIHMMIPLIDSIGKSNPIAKADGPVFELPCVAKRILLVDDNIHVLHSTKAILESMGHQVSATAQPTQALNILQRHDLDLLIVDQVMPGLSGLDLAHQAKKQCPRIAIVLMSGQFESHSAAQGLRAINASYLRKPFSQESLQRIIAQTVGNR